MIASDQNVVQLLLWLVIGTGGALITMLIWIGKRVMEKVDMLPNVVEAKLEQLHSRVLGDTAKMQDTLNKIERDLRGELAYLDRRVTRIEKFQILAHPELSSLAETARKRTTDE